MTTTSRSCTHCKFFVPGGNVASPGSGECRRFPPQVAQWTHPDYAGPQYDQHYPWVGPADWCGEHTL